MLVDENMATWAPTDTSVLEDFLEEVRLNCESAPACPVGQYMMTDCSCGTDVCDACPPGTLLGVTLAFYIFANYSQATKIQLKKFTPFLSDQFFTPFPPTKFQVRTARIPSLGTQLSAWIARAGHVMPDTTHVAHTTARTIARPTPRHKMSATCKMVFFHVSGNPQS